MRVALIGAVEFSRRMLLSISQRSDVDVTGVCTLPSNDPASDRRDLSEVSNSLGVPSIYAPDVNDESAVEWVRGRHADLILCVGWPRLLGPQILRASRLGVIGYHPTSLPKHRGRHPIIWALALGLRETGSTFFWMDEGADSGDIASQVVVAIGSEDYAEDLYEKLTSVAEMQLGDLLDELVAGRMPRQRQDHGEASYWRPRGFHDGVIDWRMPAEGIRNLVRALSKPYPGAHFAHGEHQHTVEKADVVPGAWIGIEPGRVVGRFDGEAVVVCGVDAIRLRVVDPPLACDIGETL